MIINSWQTHESIKQVRDTLFNGYPLPDLKAAMAGLEQRLLKVNRGEERLVATMVFDIFVQIFSLRVFEYIFVGMVGKSDYNIITQGR